MFREAELKAVPGLPAVLIQIVAGLGGLAMAMNGAKTGDQYFSVVGMLVIAVAAVALRLLRHFIEELVERGAQVLHQLAQFLLGSAAIHGVAKGFLRGAQIALGVGQAAFLDAQRHLPHEVGHVDEIGVGLCAREPGDDAGHAEIVAGVDIEAVGREQQRFLRVHLC